jgi:hypothetical protein
MVESGGNIVVSGEGEFNLSSLTYSGSSDVYASIVPTGTTILADSGAWMVDVYTGITSGPSSIGTNGLRTFPSSFGTDSFGIGFGFTGIVVPLGYTSGVISSVNVYNSATFASKGYTLGTYTWTWGSGATAGTLIIQIGPTNTPTPTPTNTNTPTNTLTPTPSPTPNIVTDNLQLYLQPSSYVGSGTVWDTTVGSTDATLSGSPTYNALSGFTFNGSSSYGRIPSVNGVTNFTNSDQYTVEIWFNPSNGQPNSGEAELLEKWNLNNESRYPYTIRFNENNSSMLVAAYDGSNFRQVSVTGFTVNTWVQLVAVFDFVGDTLTVYRNGISGGTTSLVGVNQVSNTSPVGIAGRVATTTGNLEVPFKGTVGIIRMYDTSLTSTQVLQNYNADKSKYIPVTPTPTPTPTNTNTPTPSSTPSIVSSGLVIQLDAYDSSSYPGTGTTVFDITGGYNHTLSGATYTVLNGIKCFDCTTGNNRVDYNATGPTLPNSGYTYITWARLTPSNTVFRTLLYTKGATKITPITIPNGTNTLGYWDTAFRSSGYDLSGQTSVWVQYAIVGTNSSQKFYINGSEVGSQIAFGSGGNTHWGWGNNDIVAQPWGHVANMYFYNRQLNLTEITQQYDYLAPRFAEPTPTPTTTSTPTVTPTNTKTPTPTPTEPFFILIQNGDILTAQDGSGIEYQH